MASLTTEILWKNRAGGQECKTTSTTVDTGADWMVSVTIGTGAESFSWGGETYDSNLPIILSHLSSIPGTRVITNTLDDVEGEGAEYTANIDYQPYAIGFPTPGDSSSYNGFQALSMGWSSHFRHLLEPQYHFDSLQMLMTAIDNGDIRPILPDVYFDIYINGTDKPSISVNWTAGEELSPVLLKPRVWLRAEAKVPLAPEVVEYQGYNVPNATGAWNVDYAGEQNYGGSYSTTYLSIMAAFEGYLNAVSKVEQWGFDGVPDYVGFYLRMDYGDDTMGELHRVSITTDGQGSSTAIADSGNANYSTYVRFHAGEPDYELPDDDSSYPTGTGADGQGNGRYDPNDLPDLPAFEESAGIGFDGNAVLTKTYSVSAQTLQNVGQKLWTQSYFNVLKIQNNPIENIVAVKHFPFETTGTSEEIKVGDVAFGVNGDKVPSVVKKVIGTCKYSGHFGNFLDLSPYTICKLNLPYIGLIQLDASDLFNSTLKVEYVIDLVTGQCMAILTLDGIPYMNCCGNMGVDVPLTSTDRVQTELKAASATISAVGGSAGQIIAGNVGGGVVSGASAALSIAGADYNSQRTAQQSPACASFENHKVFLQIERPLYNPESEGYKHLHGYPTHKYMTLQALYNAADSAQKNRGVFVAVDRRADIKIAMTAEENRMLEELLTGGVYI